MNKLLNGPRMKYYMAKTENTGMSKIETLVFEKKSKYLYFSKCGFS